MQLCDKFGDTKRSFITGPDLSLGCLTAEVWSLIRSTDQSGVLICIIDIYLVFFLGEWPWPWWWPSVLKVISYWSRDTLIGVSTILIYWFMITLSSFIYTLMFHLLRCKHTDCYHWPWPLTYNLTFLEGHGRSYQHITWYLQKGFGLISKYTIESAFMTYLPIFICSIWLPWQQSSNKKKIKI